MTTGTTPRRLQWATHADLAIDRRPTVDREDLPMDWVEAARAHAEGIPNGTPLAKYKFYLDNVWEILER
ncbi:MAG TPA: hypothetical protein EYQ31_03790 [Candidatus Handelsmanbacteria bacterium]|nr:hypothetical protein [Candidatus Handelsmanbacteria bacterium]